MSATIEIDRLFIKAFASRGDGGRPEVLNFLRRFHRYSIWNAAMIRLQRPGTLAVATVSEWSKRDRFVNAETIAIIILQPFGPIDLVYEWSALTAPTAAPQNRKICGLLLSRSASPSTDTISWELHLRIC